MDNKIKLVFFGSSDFSVFCLDELKQLGLLPNLIITTPDKPAGRKLILTPTPVKVWAETEKIPHLEPAKLNADFIKQIESDYKDSTVFLVASYGKIIPKAVIDLPQHKTLNIHPSLLPKYRGPSPLQAQILNNENPVGVSIMQIDEQVDHGPVIIQEQVTVPNWPVSFEELEKFTAKIGAKLFIDILPKFVSSELKAKEQNHNEATFTKKTEKADGLINLTNGNPFENFLKIQAYKTWPQAYFIVKKDSEEIRVIIKDAEFKDNQLVIKKVLPAGKKEMSYEDFLRGLRS